MKRGDDMKKIKYIFISMFFIFMFILTGCSVTSNGKIYLEGYTSEGSYLDLVLGMPSYEKYTVVHEKGSLKESTLLSESMISNYDRTKFYQVGNFEITINAYNCSCVIPIRVSRNQFQDIELVDKIVTYDGNAHGLDLSNEVPSGTKVLYDIGNAFTDVGEYKITATLVNDSYQTYQSTATLTIEKASYDLSGILFENTETTYDGNYKSLEITGKLPTGVSVIYSIDGYTSGRVVNAGEYTVHATFTNKNTNYNDIEPMTATLKINKAKVDMSDVVFMDAKYTYDGNPKKMKVTGELPDNVKVTYEAMYSKTGEYIDVNHLIDVGIYYVLAKFSVDETNYEPVSSMIAVLTIE